MEPQQIILACKTYTPSVPKYKTFGICTTFPESLGHCTIFFFCFRKCPRISLTRSRVFLPHSLALPTPPPLRSVDFFSSRSFLAKKPAVLAWTPRSVSLGAGSAQERPVVRVCDAGGEDGDLRESNPTEVRRRGQWGAALERGAQRRLPPRRGAGLRRRPGGPPPPRLLGDMALMEPPDGRPRGTRPLRPRPRPPRLSRSSITSASPSCGPFSLVSMILAMIAYCVLWFTPSSVIQCMWLPPQGVL